eukprot:TRINITY_DN67718_c7_g10_i1.p1 TRINITY_DN67718_c7_g10~~TRINITY_DN67718_c7_g10_i1.p1  ORF type:complete len:160 (+),score=13.61 TRINITY_DN67718_c7_g10_i1:790-1269(+)
MELETTRVSNGLAGQELSKGVYTPQVVGTTLGGDWTPHPKHNLWNPDGFAPGNEDYRPLSNKGATGDIIEVMACVPDKRLAWVADLKPQHQAYRGEDAFEVVLKGNSAMVEANKNWNVLLFPQLCEAKAAGCGPQKCGSQPTQERIVVHCGEYWCEADA